MNYNVVHSTQLLQNKHGREAIAYGIVNADTSDNPTRQQTDASKDPKHKLRRGNEYSGDELERPSCALRKSALAAMPESTTVRNSFAMEQRIEQFGRHSARFSLTSDLVHDLAERPRRLLDQFAQPKTQ